MDTLENAQKRAEYWKAEHLAANAEIERLRTLIRAHVTASNNDDTAGDTFGALMAEVPNVQVQGASRALSRSPPGTQGYASGDENE